MISEEQRRALFALREALHLCEVAEVVVRNDSFNGIVIEVDSKSMWPCFNDLRSSDVRKLIAQYPEPS